MFTPTHLIEQSVPYLVVGVQSCYLNQYTLYNVRIMYDKFQGCTVIAQAVTLILNNPRANPHLCKHA